MVWRVVVEGLGSENKTHLPFRNTVPETTHTSIVHFCEIDNRFIDLLVDKSIIDFARSIIDLGADRSRLSTSKSISKTSGQVARIESVRAVGVAYPLAGHLRPAAFG